MDGVTTVTSDVDGTGTVDSTAGGVIPVDDTPVSDATATTVDATVTASADSPATGDAGGAGSSDRSGDGAGGGGSDAGSSAGTTDTPDGLWGGQVGLAAASDVPLPPDPAGAGLALVGVLVSAAAARVSGAVGGAGAHAGVTAESVATMLRMQLRAGAIGRRLRSAAGLAPLVVGSTSLQAAAGGSSVFQWFAHAIRKTLDQVSRVVPIPGYSRYDDSDPLENDVRRAVYEEVTDSPGVYRTDVADRVDVSLSTVRYHARVLREEGLIEESKIRGKRRLFPVVADGPNAALTAALDDDPTAAVLDAVARLEPASTSEVADELDRSPSTISYHLDRLADQGLITRTRDGKAVVATLEPEVRSALAADGETAART